LDQPANKNIDDNFTISNNKIPSGKREFSSSATKVRNNDIFIRPLKTEVIDGIEYGRYFGQ
jgi:hypothetical protein